jgi:hypothetical protein
MLKLLLLMLFFVSSVNARVLSGHQEFVHYTEEQKKEFIIKVMEFVVELDERYEKAPVEEKKKYTIILEELRKILANNAYAATIDLNGFANDLTTIFDPNKDDQKRCIYAGWASQTVTTKIGSEYREICQHPNFIKGGASSAETVAYKKSSDCGKKSQNTISCNPAIFGFKNKQAGSQFCVPAGPQFSENSSYACMQLSLGVKKEKGADPSEDRISYLKKQFEGNPTLVNNLYGFIYKTCICDPDNQNVINKSYLSRTRPHRTCLGLINTIAETEHCVDFSGAKSNDMTLFKELRTFTSNLMTSKSSGNRVDTNYRELLSSIPGRFTDDYAKMCGGAPFPPNDGDKINPPGGDGGPGKDCIGECDFVEGKFVNCKFTDGTNPLEITPSEPMEEQFETELDGAKLLCKINKRGPNHKTSCSLEAKNDSVSYKLTSPEGSDVKVIATKWSNSSEQNAQSVPFGDQEKVGLTITISTQGQTAEIACGEIPKSNDKIPHIDLIPKDETKDKTNFGTKVDGDDTGWEYQWTRTNKPKRDNKPNNPKLPIQEDSKLEDGPNGNDPSKNTTTKENEPNNKDPKDPKDPNNNPNKTTADADEGPITPPSNDAPNGGSDDGPGEDLGHHGKEHTAPKEDETYQVCVQLKKGDKSSNKACKDVGKKEEATAPVVPPKANTPMNNGGPRQMPQMPLRKGVDFSRGGIL